MKPPAFVSYARKDSGFVLRLAEDLKARGANVWLDQLDIRPGQKWDAEVERALGSCGEVLVILSPASVESANVMDEVAFALDEGKIVIPVLHGDSRIPFRLRRVHYVDFRPDYDRGLEALLRALEPAEKLAVAAAAAQEPSVSGPQVNPKDGLTYVYIPAGSFLMGCSPGDNECDDDERPPRMVQIPNGFWLGQTEVTQAAWQKVMKSGNPSYFKKSDQLPLENVDWNQASAYCKAIGGRLPTEEEWEYAARAGTTGPRYGSLDAIAWYSGNSGGTTHPVGLKQANVFGLYDMLGNVWEWTSTDYPGGGGKVVRGGSWGDVAGFVRASLRDGVGPTDANDSLGFRCVGEFR